MRFHILLFLLCCCTAGIAQTSNSAWHILAEDIDPDDYYGITCANGMIGLVSSPEPMRVGEVVLNGVYDAYQRGRVSNILQTFNHADLNLQVGGAMVTRDRMTGYRQVLDMPTATLSTTFNWNDQIEVEQQLMALRHLPYTSLTVVTITTREAVVISASSVIQAPDHLRDVRNYYSEIDRPHVLIPLLTSVAESPTGRYTLAASNSFIFPEAHGEEPDIIHEDWDYNRHLAKFRKTFAAGESYTFAVVGSTVSSEHYSDPHNEAERLTIFAKLEGIERLVNRHEAAWAELWQSDIQIDGPMDVQRDVRSALYHLYAFAREGTAYSLSPMGLSGLGYNGHVFWDTEIWMFPPLLVLQPDIARSLLEYRYERLEAAMQNAFAHGYDGAMFPWESADDGSEDTPVWALTGPFQHHISGDIAWACWQYYRVTHDREWLATRGWPIIEAVADFWASRVDRSAGDTYHINNVVGANEWLENIDDNAFTNGIAITALRIGSQAAQALGKTPDPDWAHVADRIPIVQFENGVTRENQTYAGEMIKQADANLLAYPLDIVRDKEAIRKDLEYYEPRISPDGPAMGYSVLSILHQRLGNTQKAYELFLKSYQPNRVPPFGVLAETAGGTNPYFATGAGGMLQALLFGFGGLEVTDEGIVQANEYPLPLDWKKLTITGVGKEEATYELE